jgi:hypothetical protein
METRRVEGMADANKDDAKTSSFFFRKYFLERPHRRLSSAVLLRARCVEGGAPRSETFAHRKEQRRKSSQTTRTAPV